MKAESRRQKAETIAALLEYPKLEYVGRAATPQWSPQVHALHITDEVAAFLSEVRNVEPDGLEELYTRTFDLNPVATLDLGFHLYGERYERGRLMAVLRELQIDAGVDCGNDLPDHLAVVVRLIGVTEIEEPLQRQLAVAVGKIRATLDEQGNPYRHLVRAAESLFAQEGVA